MNKKDMLYRFIKRIERKKLLTLFISNLFDYRDLHDYNYLFRVINEKDKLIIDIYDNISINRFNRYVFSSKGDNINKEINNVFLTYININNTSDSDNKLSKLVYLLGIDEDQATQCARTFLDDRIVDILKTVIKK